MTYHRYTHDSFLSPLLCHYVVSLGAIFAIWENLQISVLFRERGQLILKGSIDVILQYSKVSGSR